METGEETEREREERQSERHQHTEVGENRRQPKAVLQQALIFYTQEGRQQNFEACEVRTTRKQNWYGAQARRRGESSGPITEVSLTAANECLLRRRLHSRHRPHPQQRSRLEEDDSEHDEGLSSTTRRCEAVSCSRQPSSTGLIEHESTRRHPKSR